MVKSFSSRDAGRKIISSLMDAHPKIVRPVRSSIIGSSMEFASRSSNIFNKLTPIEVKHETWMLKNETYDSFDQNNNISPEISADVFKKPLVPVSRKRKARSYPFKKEKKKWIKYSLEDIPLSSDATNSAVAFQFLNELRERKKGKVEVTGSDEFFKVVFRKPTKRSSTATNFVSSSSIDMITNEVEEQHTPLPVSGKKLKRSSDIRLSHLDEDNE